MFIAVLITDLIIFFILMGLGLGFIKALGVVFLLELVLNRLWWWRQKP